jgi:hypothetical protein
MLRHKMTADDLAHAWDTEPTETVRTLLWEIARLRATLKRAHQVRTAVGDTAPPGVSPTVWSAFCGEVDGEPCISDAPTTRQQMRAERAVKRIKD